jgi:adenylosuccinate lyase
MLNAISPIDGRYADKTKELRAYFSEYALIRYRVFVEIQYFIALCQYGLPQLESFDEEVIDDLNAVFEGFSLADAERIKAIEKTTNHDVKAVEYFLKERFDDLGLGELREFIHFGLTSQDVNNTASPLLFKNALEEVYYPLLKKLRDELERCAQEWAHIPMLARTHGQPASPTLLGKELPVISTHTSLPIPITTGSLSETVSFPSSLVWNAHHLLHRLSTTTVLQHNVRH